MKLDGEQGTVAHYLMVLEMRNYSPHTLVRYRYGLSILIQLLDSLCQVTELEQVTVLHLRQCVQHVRTAPITPQKSRRPPENGKTLAASSVGSFVRVWKSFFNWCFREELIEKNPVARLETPKEPKKVRPAFSDEQLQAIIDSLDLSTEQGFRDYIILILLTDTGLRRAEVASLRVEDVQVDYIRVLLGKGKKERRVGISPDLSTLLWKYIHKYRHPCIPDEPALFLATGRGNAGNPFGRGGISALMNRLKKLTGIDGVRLSAHTFRHTFSKMYLQEGGDVFSLSRELGHSDIRTTQRYLEDFTSENARKRHTEFSPLNRLKVRTRRTPKGKTPKKS